MTDSKEWRKLKLKDGSRFVLCLLPKKNLVRTKDKNSIEEIFVFKHYHQIYHTQKKNYLSPSRCRGAQWRRPGHTGSCWRLRSGWRRGSWSGMRTCPGQPAETPQMCPLWSSHSETIWEKSQLNTFFREKRQKSTWISWHGGRAQLAVVWCKTVWCSAA